MPPVTKFNLYALSTAMLNFIQESPDFDDIQKKAIRDSLDINSMGTTTPGTGIVTFLSTPTSANLAAAITDETGTGALVFGTSPTITNPTISGGSATLLTTATVSGNYTGGFDASVPQISVTNLSTTTTGYGSNAFFKVKAGVVEGWMTASNSVTLGNSVDFRVVSNHDFNIWTNDTKRVTISNTGNVGIGTTTPSFKLSLSGTATIDDRTIGINTIPVVYLPDQATYINSMVVGNGGRLMTNGAYYQGASNTLVGVNAGLSVTTGNDNVLVGGGAGQFQTTAIRNTYVGSGAGQSTTTGGANMFIGYQAGATNSVGSGNVAIGNSTLRYNQTGSSNTAIGSQALMTGGVTANVTSTTAIGENSGYFTTGTSYGVYIGNYAGHKNTTGSANTALGAYSGYNNQTGVNNTYVGFQSGFGVLNNNHSNNSALGKYSYSE